MAPMYPYKKKTLTLGLLEQFANGLPVISFRPLFHFSFVVFPIELSHNLNSFLPQFSRMSVTCQPHVCQMAATY